MMQKSICFDGEYEAAGAFPPLGAFDITAMIVALRSGSSDRESTETVIAFDGGRGVVENRTLERVLEG